LAYWAAVVSADVYARERLYHRDSVLVDGRTADPSRGDPVLVVAGLDPPVAFGLGRVDGARPCRIRYLFRVFDAPPPVAASLGRLATGLHALDRVTYAAAAGLVRAAVPHPDDATCWQVSVHLPIGAATAAAAVREFWTYVEHLGPRELPTFVHPREDKLAMRVYVNGRLANLDPDTVDQL
jgi:hypothetical protein